MFVSVTYVGCWYGSVKAIAVAGLAAFNGFDPRLAGVAIGGVDPGVAIDGVDTRVAIGGSSAVCERLESICVKVCARFLYCVAYGG